MQRSELCVKPPRDYERIDGAGQRGSPESLLTDLVQGVRAVEMAPGTERDRLRIVRLRADAWIATPVRGVGASQMRGLDRRRMPAGAASLRSKEGEERLVLDARLPLAELAHRHLSILPTR